MLRRLPPLLCLILFASTIQIAGRGMERGSFELRGTVVPEGGISVNEGRLGIQLQALSGAWQGRELSAAPDIGGKFRFKRIPTGMYLLTAFIPRVARVRRTIEVGPSLADKEGRIEVRIELAARRRRPGMFEVPASELTLPAAAQDEYEKGRQQLKDRNYSRAEEHYRRATELAPQYYAAWYQRGSIATRQERFSEAAGFYREALKLQPENYRALMALGEVLVTLREGEEALAVNTQAVKARPDDPQARIQLGFSMMLAGRLDQAEAHLKEAVSLDPANYCYPQLMLAEIYRRRNELPKVQRELEEFLRLHPDSPKAREIRPALNELLLQMKPVVSGNP